MQNAYYIFLNVVKRSAKFIPSHLAGIFFLLFSFSVCLANSGSAAVESPAPLPSASPDVSVLAPLPLQEAQKNSSKSYQIGDRINLLVDLRLPGLESGEHLSLNLPEGSSKLEDQGWYIDPSSQYLGGVFHFIVSPIQTGNLTLPTLIISKNDQSILGRTAPYTIQVSELAKKEGNQAAELLDISTAQLPLKYWVFLLALILFIMIGIYFIYRNYKRTKKKPLAIPEKKLEPDHEIALKKINALYQNYPFQLENLKPISFGISETLKEFFSKRFKIDAIEATTDEMIELLRSVTLSGENLKEIQILFQSLDLIKFTKIENYSHYDNGKYLDLKIQSQFIIQKWAQRLPPGGKTP